MGQAPIWRDETHLTALNASLRNTFAATLGIEVTAMGPDWLTATMPVDAHTASSRGGLHGGAALSLADVLAATAAQLVIDRERKRCREQEIVAHHVATAVRGVVSGTARPLHLGAGSQVWEVRIVDEKGGLVCAARVTMTVLDA